ncbi:MAG: thioredoxin domain-containing protein [Planctomycetaceae bacterium]|nr:thioredoxin domain-containing protein [Planctomycetaceae bacterium]
MNSASEKPRPANRLKDETSPYLQQHAYNPVDWYPWGEEAIQKSRDENKPIFLSIGYSACHWCHVMEHESFENDDIATIMNEHFVNIKVDREERPDLDQIYMNAVVALTRRGGWPMSVFLTPNLKPFFGGTYWPPQSRMGMPGFTDILNRVQTVWKDREAELMQGADELTSAVQQMGQVRSGEAELDESLLSNALRELISSTDTEHGGFGEAPKFPHPMDIRLMLRVAQRAQSEDGFRLARLTLDKMAAGGIYDHLGGGFHRYATDTRWLIPHFEKMLYDNALLIPGYLEAWQLTGEPRYEEVVRESLDYILREMTQPDGGFYSTQDADSEGEEGKFFVWQRGEVEQLLGEDAELVCACYDVTAPGNWEGKTILQRVLSDDDAAEKFDLSAADVKTKLAECREKLFERRKTRIAPGRDDKILVSWNGLMIAAMAKAGAVFNEPRYLEAAQSATSFIKQNLFDESGRLQHAWKDGRARFAGCLDDYSGLVDGLTELFLATQNVEYLEDAEALATHMLRLFQDDETGGLFFTADDHEELIARNIDTQDNATPSGNALAATALLKLGRILNQTEFEEAAERILKLLSGQMAQIPLVSGQSLMAFDLYRGPTYEAIFFPGENEDESEAIREIHRTSFLPKVLWLEAAPNLQNCDNLQALFSGRSAVNGQPTLYLCDRGRCELPVSGVEKIRERLEELQSKNFTTS